jgi:hypothetical protein
VEFGAGRHPTTNQTQRPPSRWPLCLSGAGADEHPRSGFEEHREAASFLIKDYFNTGAIY